MVCCSRTKVWLHVHSQLRSSATLSRRTRYIPPLVSSIHAFRPELLFTTNIFTGFGSPFTKIGVLKSSHALFTWYGFVSDPVAMKT